MENTTKALLLLIALAVMAVLYVVLIVWIIKKILKRKNSGKPPLSGKQIFRRIYIVFSVCNLLVGAALTYWTRIKCKRFFTRTLCAICTKIALQILRSERSVICHCS